MLAKTYERIDAMGIGVNTEDITGGDESKRNHDVLIFLNNRQAEG